MARGSTLIAVFRLPLNTCNGGNRDDLLSVQPSCSQRHSITFNFDRGFQPVALTLCAVILCVLVLVIAFLFSC